MNDRGYIGAIVIHREMHQQLGRRVSLTCHLVPFEVGGHHHVWRHEPLRHTLRSCEQVTISESDGDVAVVGRDIGALMQAASDLDDLRA